MTLEYIPSKKSEYKGILIDTNLLLLFFAGMYDHIERFKRISKYSLEDFNKLINLINHFTDKIFITSYILAEICNLSENFNEKNNRMFFRFIEDFISSINEYATISSDIIKDNQTAFYKFGITDTSVVNLARQNTLTITDDFNLYHYLSSQNLDVINYNHLYMM